MWSSAEHDIPGTVPPTGLHGAPRLSARLIPRPELTALLDGPHPLVIVRGVLGIGKTTALAQWAAERAPRGVWAELSEATSSRRALWEHVLTLMADAGLDGGGLSLADAARAVAATPDLMGLLRRVSAALAEPAVVVLDQYGLVADERVNEDVVMMLRHSRLLRIVVATRGASPLEGTKVGLELDRLLIGADQLGFGPEETAAALRAAGARVDDAVAARVHRAVGGIPLAVRAAAVALVRDRGEALGPLPDDRFADGLRSYFTTTLLDAYAGTPYLDFLLRVSVADRMPLALAAELGGVDSTEATRHLDHAEADGLGMWSGSEGGSRPPRFSLSAMVRASLVEELRLRSPRRAVELGRAYARWCHRNADPFTAILEAVRAGDLDLASRALRGCFLTIGYLHGDALMALLGGVPEATLRRHPALAMFVASHLNAREATRRRGLAWFRLAATSARARARETDDESYAYGLGVVETVAARMIGRDVAALDAADRTMGRYRGLSAAARAELGRDAAPTLAVTGSTYWFSGRIPTAIAVYQEAYAAGLGDRDDDCLTVPLLAGAYATRGEMPRAVEMVERARGLDWPEEQRNDFFGSPLRLAEAILALEVFDLDAAQRAVDAVERTFISYEYGALFVPVQAFVDAASGHAAAGLARLRDARIPGARPATSVQLAALHDACEALLHLAAGEADAAERSARRLPAAHPVTSVMRALLSLLTGDAARAVAQTYPDEEDAGHAAPDPRVEAILLLLRAAAAVRSGHEVLALRSLDTAVALLERHRLGTPLAFLPVADREALRELATAAGALRSAAAVTGARSGHAIPELFPATVARIALTPRERRLLRYLAGTSAPIPEIAAALNVAPKTLRNQRTSLYRKLGVGTREEAVRVAYERGLLGG